MRAKAARFDRAAFFADRETQFDVIGGQGIARSASA